MLLMSSFTLGILFLCGTSLAQSAPYVYDDLNNEEEAFVDRLASYLESQQIPRQGFSGKSQQSAYYADYNNNQPDFLNRREQEYLAQLPPQFAYRPDDVRFYLPADGFPGPNVSGDENDKADNTRVEGPPPQDDYERVVHSSQLDPGRGPQEVEEDRAVGEPEQHDHEVDTLEMRFMKKNDQGRDEIGPISHEHQIIADPNNIVASGHSVEGPYHILQSSDSGSTSYYDFYYIGLIAGCSAAMVVGLVAAGIFWYRIHQRVKAAAEVEYPAYGVTGPSKDVSPTGGDRKLAQSAQMYHYQHQKQQMAALQKGALQGDRQGSAGSDVESEEENDDENDYTVYECPGLAPAGEMEVKNPLFQDETTPATPSVIPEEEK